MMSTGKNLKLKEKGKERNKSKKGNVEVGLPIREYIWKILI